MSILKELSEKVIAGKAADVTELTNKALADGHSASEILDDAMIVGMKEIGDRFKRGDA